MQTECKSIKVCSRFRSLQEDQSCDFVNEKRKEKYRFSRYATNGVGSSESHRKWEHKNESEIDIERWTAKWLATRKIPRTKLWMQLFVRWFFEAVAVFIGPGAGWWDIDRRWHFYCITWFRARNRLIELQIDSNVYSVANERKAQFSFNKWQRPASRVYNVFFTWRHLLQFFNDASDHLMFRCTVNAWDVSTSIQSRSCASTEREHKRLLLLLLYLTPYKATSRKSMESRRRAHSRRPMKCTKRKHTAIASGKSRSECENRAETSKQKQYKKDGGCGGGATVIIVAGEETNKQMRLMNVSPDPFHSLTIFWIRCYSDWKKIIMIIWLLRKLSLALVRQPRLLLTAIRSNECWWHIHSMPPILFEHHFLGDFDRVLSECYDRGGLHTSVSQVKLCRLQFSQVHERIQLFWLGAKLQRSNEWQHQRCATVCKRKIEKNKTKKKEKHRFVDRLIADLRHEKATVCQS